MSLADLNPIPVSAVEVGARALVAMAAGALIGIERQWHHRAAGMRTHALLALGAAGFALPQLLRSLRTFAITCGPSSEAASIRMSDGPSPPSNVVA